MDPKSSRFWIGMSAAFAGLFMSPVNTILAAGTPCIDLLAVLLCVLGFVLACTRGPARGLALCGAALSFAYCSFWSFLAVGSASMLTGGDTWGDWFEISIDAVLALMAIWNLANLAALLWLAFRRPASQAELAA